MKAIKWVLFSAFVLGFIVWLVNISLPTEEDRIHNRIGGLLRVLDTMPGDSTLKRVAQVERVIDYFTPDVVVRLQGSTALEDSVGRDALMEAVRATIMGANRLRIERYDTRTKVAPNQVEGTVTMTVFGYFNDRQNPNVQLVRLAMRKQEGEWRISKVETVQPIEQ